MSAASTDRHSRATTRHRPVASRAWSRSVPAGLAWLLALGLALATPVAARAEDDEQAPAPSAQPVTAAPKPEATELADEQPTAKPATGGDEQTGEPTATATPEPGESATPSPAASSSPTATPSAAAPASTTSASPTNEATPEPTPSVSAAAPATSHAADRGTTDLTGFAVSPLAGTPGTSVDNGNGTSTYTYWDGETVTYPNRVVPGESFRVSGAGWLTVANHPQVDEGDEGSVIGFKFMPASGSVIRTVRVPNPRTGEADYPSPDVWDIAQAAGTGDWWDGATPGSWTIDIPWPTADLAQNPPTLAAGETVTLQLLSGTLYSNEVCTGGCTRPDVSRTIALTLTVAGEPAEPEPVAPTFTLQPRDLTVTEGQDAHFTVAVVGAPEPTLQWQAAEGQDWVAIPGATGTTLTLAAAGLDRTGQRVRAVATNTAGSTPSAVATLTVEPGSTTAAPVVTGNPQDATRTEGQLVTFTAAASGTPAPAVQWQRSADGGLSWLDLRGATATSYTIDAVTRAQNGQRFRAVFRNPAAPDGVATTVATLTVTPRDVVREYCGTSYGPGAANTGIPFCFRGPEKVVAGQPIVIEGVSGYLATDSRTGSVVNFFFDAEFSGDPNTVYAKRLFTNPATGQQVSDRRTHAIVQAAADGSWRVEIPWPTLDAVSPTSDGKGSYSQADLDAKFAPGTTHSFRMLTGSLLSNPPDRQRGGSLYFTVVESLDDQVALAEPPYQHQTFASEEPGDQAVAWLQQQVSSGQTAALTGTGWLTKDRQWGSTVTVRLQDETGAYYRNPANPADPTVWQVVQASETGDLDVRLPLPAEAGGGDFVAVELTTTDDGTALGDVARYWVSEPLTIDNVPYVPEPGQGATCTAAPGAASYHLAPGMATPAANVGGSIRLTGRNWCNLVGGGSLIAIKLNDGAYSHRSIDTARLFDANLGKEVGSCPAGACASNKTIWYTIEADRYGSFDVTVPLPTRADSVPAFGEGSYTLRLMTRTLSADPYYQGKRPDPSRTMKTPEFTVVAEGVPLENVKPGRPSAAPDPLHATEDLTAAARGGVQIDQQAKRWVVTVPAAAPGDWVYVNLYDGQSPRFPWNNTWYQVNDKHRVTLPLAGASLPTGTNKLSVQDRSGGLLGWTTATVAAPKTGGTLRPITLGAPQPASLLLGQPRPAKAPAQPVPGYADLDDSNVGTLTAVTAGGTLTVTIPPVAGGHWVYPFLYTQTGQVVATDWVQVGTDHTITVAIGGLPDGIHKLALVNAEGTLVGWVTANGPAALPAADPDTGVADVPGTSGEPAGSVPAGAAAPPAPVAGDTTITLVLLGLAVLVLAGSASGVIVLRTPARPRP